MSRPAYLATVWGWQIIEAMPLTDPQHVVRNIRYQVCSECSAIVKETWSHKERCSAFVDEPLRAWIKMGIGELL